MVLRVLEIWIGSIEVFLEEEELVFCLLSCLVGCKMCMWYVIESYSDLGLYFFFVSFLWVLGLGLVFFWEEEDVFI